jgi:hypothetical protein
MQAFLTHIWVLTLTSETSGRLKEECPIPPSLSQHEHQVGLSTSGTPRNRGSLEEARGGYYRDSWVSSDPRAYLGCGIRSSPTLGLSHMIQALISCPETQEQAQEDRLRVGVKP